MKQFKVLILPKEWNLKLKEMWPLNWVFSPCRNIAVKNYSSIFQFLPIISAQCCVSDSFGRLLKKKEKHMKVSPLPVTISISFKVQIWEWLCTFSPLSIPFTISWSWFWQWLSISPCLLCPAVSASWQILPFVIFLDGFNDPSHHISFYIFPKITFLPTNCKQ